MPNALEVEVNEKPYRYKNHRKLPGQSALSDEQWAEIEWQEVEALWAEDAEREQCMRRERINLAENFKALRLRLDLTQAEMANKLGLSLRSLQMYERGERPITSDVLTELYALYNIDFHQLFTAAPREPTPNWKEAFSEYTLRVAARVSEAYPHLTVVEANALTKKFMRHEKPDGTIDEGDLLMLYNKLTKSDDLDS